VVRVSGQNFLSGLAVDNANLYWTDQAANRVWQRGKPTWSPSAHHL